MNNSTLNLTSTETLSYQEKINFLSIRRKAILTSKAFRKWHSDISRELKRLELQHKATN